ncbi:UDP-N-acetylmuramoyl-tripeptide--D-alanyl-D-alanine ligase [Proteiniclasticum sp. SCR006]|uniref:UDP-N-acetylmuramoyl-tripeptide--D-alanyl-D-alanine ligase n=1 Tax=Proteiniclasticum aestuarii TaxID=2817862 RepID=A0A939H9Y9_9CLOT|nr:UDP-N-acetylmuramoyl-tripeptide--D-alanyl-D-alanine ligase [Proteiniclasticum aestuarii]MBO1263765.1 UDP-N-acetylmuramoyl-tripeptide--D-alanyl-D-alanine ligase [Proteiniclasticum aestuarii]
MKTILVKEIVEHLDATLYGSAEASFDAVFIDSRIVTENALFIGIKGEHFNGNEHYMDAFRNGASVAVVEEVEIGEIPEGKAVLKVKSTYRAILDLAYYYRKMLNLKIIGITGSTGKTSTKDILHGMLSKKYKVFKTSGNYNNELGLPLMIFSLDETYDYAILEMGMSAPLEIHNLARVAQPDIALITNIGLSHIEFLGSQENILKAKMEITDFFEEDSLLVLNGDDEYLRNIGDKPYRVVYGGLSRGDYIARNISIAEDYVEFTVNRNKEIIRLDIPGKHNVQNGILCYIVAKELGIKDEDLSHVSILKSSMRMDVIRLDQLTIINDCYNANPDSTKAAIDYLANFEGRKVAVIGTMKELGEESLAAHESVAYYAKTREIDLFIAIGEYMDEMTAVYGEGAVGFSTFEEAEQNIGKHLKREDVVLIKASRGMYFERFIPVLEQFGGKE